MDTNKFFYFCWETPSLQENFMSARSIGLQAVEKYVGFITSFLVHESNPPLFLLKYVYNCRHAF